VLIVDVSPDAKILREDFRNSFKERKRMKLFRKQIVVVAAYLALLLSFAGASYSQDKVDLNSATESQLVDLPGVGKATAKKIIAGRPYSAVSDLSKAGVSNATITKITPLVTVGSGSAAASSSKSAASKSAAPDSSTAMTPKKSKSDSAAASSASSGPVDLNTASEADLIALNGVGKATAAKIIAGRPYSSVSDLSKAGVSKATITKIQGQVTVSGSAAASSKSTPAPAPSAPASSPAPSKSAPAASSSASSSAPASAPAASTSSASATKSAAPKAAPRTEQAAGGGNGLVWVNTKSGVYHKEGDRWYGRTEEGKYMSEADALKAGYRAEKKRESKTAQ
jgi:DNA uptake protein ComE-like DNA-binding protein